MQQIVVVAEAGYVFGDFKQLVDVYKTEAEVAADDELSTVYGCNGYESSVKETHTVLFARGPTIKKHVINKGGDSILHPKVHLIHRYYFARKYVFR